MEMNLNLNTAPDLGGKSLANSDFSGQSRKDGTIPGTESINVFEKLLAQVEAPKTTVVTESSVEPSAEMKVQTQDLLEELMKRGGAAMPTPPVAVAPTQTAGTEQTQSLKEANQLKTEVKLAGLAALEGHPNGVTPSTRAVSVAAQGGIMTQDPSLTKLVSAMDTLGMTPATTAAATVPTELKALGSKVDPRTLPERGDLNLAKTLGASSDLAAMPGMDNMRGQIEGLTLFEPAAQKTALHAIASERQQTGADFVQTLQAAQSPRVNAGTEKAVTGERKLDSAKRVEGEISPLLSPEATLASSMLRAKAPSEVLATTNVGRKLGEGSATNGKSLRKGAELESALEGTSTADKSAGMAASGGLLGGQSLSSVPTELSASTTAGAATRPRITSESLVNIGAGISQLSNLKGGGEMRIRLKPENLGELVLKISTQGNHVGLQVMASDDRAKAVIEDSINALKDNLASKNLSLGSVDVTVVATQAGRDGADFNSQAQNHQQSQMQMGDPSSREREGASQWSSGENTTDRNGAAAGRKAMGLRALGSTGISSGADGAAAGRLNVFA